jgi:hypothetical protein
LPDALALAGPGWPRLLGWEQPCCLRFQLPTAKSPSRLELPAHVSLAWDDQSASYLLVSDLGTSHLRVYRPMLHHLHALRRAGGEASRLVIATDSRRAGAWEVLLDDVARYRRDAPLRVWIAWCKSFDADLTDLLDVENLKSIPDSKSAELPQAAQLAVCRPGAAIPRPVGDLTTGTESIDAEASYSTSSWSTIAARPAFAPSCESSTPTTSTWKPAASAVTIHASPQCWS